MVLDWPSGNDFGMLAVPPVLLPSVLGVAVPPKTYQLAV